MCVQGIGEVLHRSSMAPVTVSTSKIKFEKLRLKPTLLWVVFSNAAYAHTEAPKFEILNNFNLISHFLEEAGNCVGEAKRMSSNDFR